MERDKIHSRERQNAESSRDDIDRAIEEEIAFHLEQSRRELVNAGTTDAQAAAEALRRFGNVETVMSKCRLIDTGGNLMLRKIHVAVTVVLIAATVLMGVLLFRAHQRNVEARQALEIQESAKRALQEQMHSMQQIDAASNLNLKSQAYQIYGLVNQAGKYPWRPGLKLSECVIDAEPAHSNVAVEVHRIENGFPVAISPVALAEIDADPTLDIEIRPGDSLRVHARDTKMWSMNQRTGVVYLEGEVSRPGVYQLPIHDSLTIRRLLVGAGGTTDDAEDLRVLIRRMNRVTEKQELVLDTTLAQLTSDSERDIEILANDHIRVVAPGASE